MKLDLILSADDLRRLARLTRNDLDSADKNALQGLLWQIAEMADLCDEYGNSKCSANVANYN